MTKRLIKTRKDHRQVRALLNDNTTTQTMLPAAGALTAGTIGTAYAGVSFSLSAPVGNSHFAVSAGSLPAGLTLSDAGVLSGTPTGPAGNASFSVRGTDDFGNTVVNAYTLSVAA